MKLLFGNVAPREVTSFTDDGQPVYTDLPVNGEVVTEVAFPDGILLMEAANTVTLPNGVLERHSAAAPSWVSSDSAGLASLLAEHYDCPTRPWSDQ